jgi:hypothetical protein
MDAQCSIDEPRQLATVQVAAGGIQGAAPAHAHRYLDAPQQRFVDGYEISSMFVDLALFFAAAVSLLFWLIILWLTGGA